MPSVSAIGSSAFPRLSGAGKSTAVLDAQLAKYQVQLADWVNCASCNTLDGKAKIRELSDKVSDTQQRIKAADARRQGSSATVQAVNSTTNDNRNIVLPALNVVGLGGGSSRSVTSTTDTIGVLLNVFV